MPTATAVKAQSQSGNASTKGAPTRIIPFVRAAHQHTEPGGLDNTTTPGASAVTVGPIDVPAYGFLRYYELLVSFSGGTLGAGSLAPDFPFNVFDEVVLFDINGAPVYGPTNGWDLFLVNLVGGYAWWTDVRQSPDFVSSINAFFVLRIPVEITPWDGYGALPNESAAAAFKMRFTITASANLFPTAPTTVPAVRTRGFLEAWSHPSSKDVFGATQATAPPGVMTVQYWTQFVKTLNAGTNTTQLVRTGNLIRNFVAQTRNNTAVGNTTQRDGTVFPDPTTFNWDNRQLHSNITQSQIRQYMFEKLGLSAALTAPSPGAAGATQGAAILPAGLFFFDFTSEPDSHPGNEARNLWLPTAQPSRLELLGNSATAGTAKIITNDVAPVAGR